LGRLDFLPVTVIKNLFDMKHLMACCTLMCIFFTNMYAQDSSAVSQDSVLMAAPISTSSMSANAKGVYRITWKADAPITGAGLGLSVLGLSLIQNKDNLDSMQLAMKSFSDIPGFDRGNAGFYDENANSNSYIPFFASFAMPLIMVVADKNERQQAGKILVMYTESLAITSALYTITAGSIDRSRPLVYPDKNGNIRAPYSKRISNNSQRSFYAGHVAASASASFFAAKVFCDLNPDSKFKPYIWTIAAALPAITGYYRYKAGEHFLSDNILGYVLGAGTGILVPQLHKNKNFDRVSITPAIWPDAKGISIAYNF
jgi:membrane-associated phospholipid phosphatase